MRAGTKRFASAVLWSLLLSGCGTDDGDGRADAGTSDAGVFWAECSDDAREHGEEGDACAEGLFCAWDGRCPTPTVNLRCEDGQLVRVVFECLDGSAGDGDGGAGDGDAGT